MGEKKRIIFMGSDAIALPTLSLLAQEKQVELVAVFTQPDRPSGRGKRLRANPIKEWSVLNGTQVREPERPGKPDAQWLSEQRVDIVIVMAYGHILSSALLQAAGGRFYNLHASLLPAYRGASPVETALAEGESNTGVSLMRLVQKMDAGPLVDQELVAIDPDDGGPSLRQKLATACLPLLSRNFPDLLSGEVREEPQDDQSATYCRLLRKDDGRLDFSKSAHLLARRVAAFRSWPGCFIEFGDLRIKVGFARPNSQPVDASPGTVLGERNGALSVATGDGSLELLELQRPGGKMLAAPDFLRGFPALLDACMEIFPATPLVRKKLGFSTKNEKTD
ncbi:MAG: methionyl-tRNA formyltransferase [Opitutae bacterium]|nr:methionyl-tRNA formyltransferase [Opitutae bacterium]